MQVSVFGGPSFFQVDQDLVTGVRWTEAYPYDSVTFTSTMTETRSESGTGFNVGADVGYFMSRHFGVGGRVQYASGTVDLALCQRHWLDRNQSRRTSGWRRPPGALLGSAAV